MYLVKPNVELIEQPEGRGGIYTHVELCTRICYKSEDKIKQGSALPVVSGLIEAKHLAPLEHGTVYLALPCETIIPIEANDWGKFYYNPYSKGGKICEVNGEKRVAITTNFRVIIENGWDEYMKYLCEPTEYHPRRYTLKFTCTRIDSQSITRYRKDSFTQESQRFVNYMKEKFGMSVTFVEPVWVKPEDLEELKKDVQISEQLYFKWLNKGYKPEEARYFLINGTKTEIIVTAFEEDWSHFFDQRLRGNTGRPSPDMYNLAELAWNEFKDKLNLEL